MTRETESAEIVSDWNGFSSSKKLSIIDNAIHPCAANHQGITLAQIKSVGDSILQQPLSDILEAMTDIEFNDIYAEYLSVK